jgi:hypothetical protein
MEGELATNTENRDRIKVGPSWYRGWCSQHDHFHFHQGVGQWPLPQATQCPTHLS